MDIDMYTKYPCISKIDQMCFACIFRLCASILNVNKSNLKVALLILFLIGLGIKIFFSSQIIFVFIFSNSFINSSMLDGIIFFILSEIVLIFMHSENILWYIVYSFFLKIYLFIYLFLTLFYFTILYWFCHTLTWIHHRCRCIPRHEPPSHLPPHNISLGHHHAPIPSMLYPTSDIDWQFDSYMIVYMFQCHSPKSSHPLPLPQSL